MHKYRRLSRNNYHSAFRRKDGEDKISLPPSLSPRKTPKETLVKNVVQPSFLEPRSANRAEVTRGGGPAKLECSYLAVSK